MWDAIIGVLLFRLYGDGTEIISANWSPDDHYIALGTSRGQVEIHLTMMTDLLDAACHIATRNLTQLEWQVYFPSEPYRQTCLNLPPGS